MDDKPLDMPEEHRCGECGKNFGSEDILEKHEEIEHDTYAKEKRNKNINDLKPDREQVIGAFLGFLLAAFFISGVNYVQSAEFDVGDTVPNIGENLGSYYDDITEPTVQITVVTCDNCSYSRFREETNSIMKADYREVDYRSEKGQKLVERYKLNHIPGFIFDSEVERAENFTEIESILVEFEDAYIIPDKGIEAAQRMSDGKELE